MLTREKVPHVPSIHLTWSLSLQCFSAPPSRTSGTPPVPGHTRAVHVAAAAEIWPSPGKIPVPAEPRM